MGKNISNKASENESFGKWLLQVFVMAAILLGIYYLIFSFVLSNETVSGPSMQPTFENGDRIIAVRHTSLKRGDIVILNAPDEPGALYIKRIVGMPGDSITYKNDQLYLNGKKYSEPYLTEGKKLYANGQLYTENFSLKSKFGVNKVPSGEYFVMGDHRNVSKDSRYFGFVKRKAIVGKVIFRYWPLTKWSTF